MITAKQVIGYVVAVIGAGMVIAGLLVYLKYRRLLRTISEATRGRPICPNRGDLWLNSRFFILRDKLEWLVECDDDPDLRKYARRALHLQDRSNMLNIIGFVLLLLGVKISTSE